MPSDSEKNAKNIVFNMNRFPFFLLFEFVFILLQKFWLFTKHYVVSRTSIGQTVNFLWLFNI